MFETLIAGGADAALIVQDYPAPGLDESKPYYRADGDAFADAVLAAHIPGAIVSTLPENLDAETRAHFIARGVAPAAGFERSARRVRRGVRWSAARRRFGEQRAPPLVAVKPSLPRYVDEAEGKRILSAAGVAVPAGMLCSAAQAPAVAARLGFPVALKLMSESSSTRPRLCRGAEPDG